MIRLTTNNLTTEKPQPSQQEIEVLTFHQPYNTITHTHLSPEALRIPLLRIPKNVQVLRIQHQNVGPNKRRVEHHPKHHHFPLQIQIQMDTLQNHIPLH